MSGSLQPPNSCSAQSRGAGLGGLRAGYRLDNGMDFALVGRNITDEVVVEGGINFLNLTAFVNEPAYWGLEFRTRF